MAQALGAAALRRHAEANALVKRRGSRKATRRLGLDALYDAAQLIFKEDAKVAKSRLPLGAAVAYAFCTLGFFGMIFVTRCATDRYSFGNWNDPCRPCICDSAGLLVSCAIPAELKTGHLYFQKQQITAIKPGAFRGNNYLIGGVRFFTRTMLYLTAKIITMGTNRLSPSKSCQRVPLTASRTCEAFLSCHR